MLPAVVNNTLCASNKPWNHGLVGLTKLLHVFIALVAANISGCDSTLVQWALFLTSLNSAWYHDGKFGHREPVPGIMRATFQNLSFLWKEHLAAPYACTSSRTELSEVGI